LSYGLSDSSWAPHDRSSLCSSRHHRVREVDVGAVFSDRIISILKLRLKLIPIRKMTSLNEQYSDRSFVSYDKGTNHLPESVHKSNGDESKSEGSWKFLLRTIITILPKNIYEFAKTIVDNCPHEYGAIVYCSNSSQPG
jgi:predicted metal-dependent peptidase